ncbi:hypothetical protein BAY61_18835 [Prauserella marina]|uniref:Uncharacterized protein n=1 Tax=Prauserella marina TaxID=530584 RepID=A0A222VS01_9PSEU|nr:hypothetical protein [Prauserella marina]ASR36716.1 hypothetical protein BAY61_18835 [Prauserella marina]PWV80407.1 hypothetical protein DES30_103499 [Prauserella marina]SDD53653.1 hypothetical protein SAMN05421630_109284 [Prauserella marina]
MFELRNVLRMDALASGALGLILATLCAALAEPLGIPVPLSLTAGVALVGWAVFVGWVSSGLRQTLVREVIAINVLYVLASAAYAFLGGLTGLGTAFVLAQALAVLGLTAAQATGLFSGLRHGARTA